jgi:DNA ligase-associated metallophosphoesterase
MSSAFAEIALGGEPVFLLPQKALYRPEKRQLVLGDLHLGKTTHFRKQGLPLPLQGQLHDLDRLNTLLHSWNPATVMILGDLFHSVHNREWQTFKAFLQDWKDVRFILVKGNHDILQHKDYFLPNLETHDLVRENNLVFSHHPLPESELLNICAHVHPGIRVSGKAKQSMVFPCFCLQENHFILPAFGYLTGLHILEQEPGKSFYLVANDRVIKL